MSKIIESSCKLCRREGMKLFLKGDRCYLDKCSYERRSYPPGQAGQRRLKFSEFALQLREKQKARRYYGVLEGQFRKYYQNANRVKGDTGLNLLRQLEMRFDNVVYTLGYASSRREARQLISHNHFSINSKRANVSSAVLKVDDMVVVEEKKRDIKIMAGIESSKKRQLPSWLVADHGKFQGEVKALPSREEVSLQVEENMIVEFYSR